MSDRLTITAAICGGILDGQLAALVWLRGEGRVPLALAGRRGSGRHALGAAVRSLLAAAGEAPAQDVQQRIIEAESLAEVLGPTAVPPGASIPDQLRGLGTVLVVRDVPRVGRRVTAAHYVRPVERDAAGHLQHRPPALLAAWDEQADRFDHFWWGITAELADRTGSAAAQFEQAHTERAALLEGLSDAGLLADADLRRGVRALRMAGVAGAANGPDGATGRHAGH